MVEMGGILGVVGIVVMNQIEQAEVQREPNIVLKGCYCTHRGAPTVAAISSAILGKMLQNKYRN